MLPKDLDNDPTYLALEPQEQRAYRELWTRLCAGGSPNSDAQLLHTLVTLLTRRLPPAQPHQRTWEIWSEGYVTTGQSSGAIRLGVIKAATFQEACDLHFGHEQDYDSKALRHWACKLFDNEADARRSFG
jgi:hypothetical protein